MRQGINKASTFGILKLGHSLPRWSVQAFKKLALLKSPTTQTTLIEHSFQAEKYFEWVAYIIDDRYFISPSLSFVN